MNELELICVWMLFVVLVGFFANEYLRVKEAERRNKRNRRREYFLKKQGEDLRRNRLN